MPSTFWNFEKRTQKIIVNPRKGLVELYLWMMEPQQQRYNLNQKTLSDYVLFFLCQQYFPNVLSYTLLNYAFLCF